MEVNYIQHCGNDLAVVNAARVSFSKKSEWASESECPTNPHTGGKIPPYRRLKEKDAKLINYLARNKHYSPFNHSFITLYTKAPIFVARQLQKHEYMPWNEISRRYVSTPPEFYDPEWREKPEGSVKQGSGENKPLDEDSEMQYNYIQNDCLRLYGVLLERGYAAEQARMVLPQNTYTEWYWSGTLKAWAKMYKLRVDDHAQEETRMIAEQCGTIISDLFPVSWEALVNSEVVR